jgi:outer membrane protein assembly factor BamB/tetratricopeptide (TPR) repeat protein
MGFQGQLSSVSLTDLFQTLQMNRQTGTLSVSSPDGQRHIYFDSGQVAMCDAPPIDGKAFLLHALLRKSLLSPEQVDDLNQRLYSLGHPLRDLIIASGYVQEGELDEASAWCIEELVCPIFEWHEGDFTFTDGAPIPQLQVHDVVAMGAVGLQTTQLLLEATRRKDEWRRIREVITDSAALYVVDNDGRNNLRNIQTDPEMLKVLRYLDGRHTLDQVASSVGVTRFDTYAIAAQLVLAGVARARTPDEVVVDANALRQSGETESAMSLLEAVHKLNPVPEVIRPLAECYAQLKQAPRAVELYLELIQMAQDQGDLEQARRDLDTVLALSPDDPDLQFDRAKVLAELGAIEDAALAYVAAAQAYIATRDTSRAIDACHRAKNLLPRSPDPHRFLAKAYLMDGQTENALVEYKSLWHALLTSVRPRQALETLKQVLESDCRFSNIKEQVLNHAQNSEAIKTSKATRVLVYLMMGVVVAAAGVAGYQWYLTVVREDKARQAFDVVKASASEKQRSGKYQAIFVELNALRTDFGGTKIIPDVDTFDLQVKQDYEARAAEQVQTAKAFQANGQHPRALETLNAIRVNFPGTKAAEQANALLSSVSDDQISIQVNAEMENVNRAWNALDWDGALALLQTLLERKDLPNKLRAELTTINSDWTTRNETAKDLHERAEKFEQAGRKKEALTAYKRASKGKGELYAAKAAERLTTLEVEFAKEIGQAALAAFDRGDEKQAFAALDELATQVKQASSKGVVEYTAKLALPFVVGLDSHLAVLVIKQGGAERVIKAPAGKRGPWQHRLTYLASESVTIEARRPGFNPATFLVSYQSRKGQVQLALTRGPLWQTTLGGAAGVTTPIALGKFVLVSTNKATIEVIDANLGATKAITFPQTVDEFRQAPVIFQNYIFSILENRLTAVDATTRTAQWTYPATQGESPLRLTGSLLVQEHQLIPGQMLFYLGSTGGDVLCFARDQDGKLIPYPKLQVGNDLTGQLFGDMYEPGKTLLYVPAGNHLKVFDTTAVTEQDAAKPLYDLRTRGELQGHLVRATVSGRPAMLAIDSSGMLVAVDANPEVADSKRALGAWPLEGTGVLAPAYRAGQNLAYVAVAEGRVVAVDLTRPGQLAWRFPAQGNAGPLAAAPAIGQRGVYIADQQGTLRCLDAATGAERWHADLGSPASSGLLVHEGRIFIPTRAGMLLCFEEGEE